MLIWRIIFYILGLFPWIFIVLLMTFYSKAGQALGHTPTYNNPDPGELDIYKYYSPLIEFAFSTWLNSLIIWVLLTIFYFIKLKKKTEWTPIVISGIGQIAGILLLFSGVFEWYID